MKNILTILALTILLGCTNYESDNPFDSSYEGSRGAVSGVINIQGDDAQNITVTVLDYDMENKPVSILNGETFTINAIPSTGEPITIRAFIENDNLFNIIEFDVDIKTNETVTISERTITKSPEFEEPIVFDGKVGSIEGIVRLENSATHIAEVTLAFPYEHSISVKSDDTGYFYMEDIPVGTAIIDVYTEDENGNSYESIEYQLVIEEGKTNDKLLTLRNIDELKIDSEGWIYYVSKEDGTDNIWKCRPDGSLKTKVSFFNNGYYEIGNVFTDSVELWFTIDDYSLYHIKWNEIGELKGDVFNLPAKFAFETDNDLERIVQSNDALYFMNYDEIIYELKDGSYSDEIISFESTDEEIVDFDVNDNGDLLVSLKTEIWEFDGLYDYRLVKVDDGGITTLEENSAIDFIGEQLASILDDSANISKKVDDFLTDSLIADDYNDDGFVIEYISMFDINSVSSATQFIIECNFGLQISNPRWINSDDYIFSNTTVELGLFTGAIYYNDNLGSLRFDESTKEIVFGAAHPKWTDPQIISEQYSDNYTIYWYSDLYKKTVGSNDITFLYESIDDGGFIKDISVSENEDITFSTATPNFSRVGYDLDETIESAKVESIFVKLSSGLMRVISSGVQAKAPFWSEY
jgi:hypothetical protein